MRSANCGLNTPTTPSCESIEDQTLGYFKMFRYLFLNNKISNFNRNLTDDLVLTTFDSQTTWKMIEVELGYAYDVYYTKAFLFFTQGRLNSRCKRCNRLRPLNKRRPHL